jgi:putative tricarboxylic transport membrane protein
MRKNDLISSLFFLACGLLITAGSLMMPIGRLGEPGPGFLPLFVGIFLALLSAALFIRSLRLKMNDQKAFGLGRKERFKVITTSLSLLLYCVALKPLGFVLVTFLLLLFLFKVTGGFNWKMSIAGPVLITLFFYLLFAVWLEVQFPMGPFGM